MLLRSKRRVVLNYYGLGSDVLSSFLARGESGWLGLRAPLNWRIPSPRALAAWGNFPGPNSSSTITKIMANSPTPNEGKKSIGSEAGKVIVGSLSRGIIVTLQISQTKPTDDGMGNGYVFGMIKKTGLPRYGSPPFFNWLRRQAQIVMKDKDQLFSDLREKGFRLTPQRERIVDIFYEQPIGEHLGAEELYNILKKEQTDISLATSYRTLKLLASVGVLREVDFADDRKQYELIRDEKDPHHHLVCVTCGLALEFDSQVAQTEAQAIANARGFDMVDLQIKLLAKCQPTFIGCPMRDEV
jgi:Fur family transcriptional regulator, ferric uptake regulator